MNHPGKLVGVLHPAGEPRPCVEPCRPERTPMGKATASRSSQGALMNPTIRVREAASEDASAMAALLDELGYPASAEDIRARWLRLHATGWDRIYVAEEGDQLIGLLCLHLMTV